MAEHVLCFTMSFAVVLRSKEPAFHAGPLNLSAMQLSDKCLDNLALAQTPAAHENRMPIGAKIAPPNMLLHNHPETYSPTIPPPPKGAAPLLQAWFASCAVACSPFH